LVCLHIWTELWVDLPFLLVNLNSCYIGTQVWEKHKNQHICKKNTNCWILSTQSIGFYQNEDVWQMHSWLGYHNKDHDTHLFYVLNPKARFKQNECFKMLNNERGICIFRLSINKYYNEDSNQLNKFWMSCSSINQKGMRDYLNIQEWHTFIWSVKTLLRNQIMSFFCTHISYISFQTFEMYICN
jgi:hypothetical protein